MIWSVLRHHVGRLVPGSAKIRLRDYSRKRNNERRKREREAAIARHGQFGAVELVAVLRDAGIAEGCVLFAQCSMNDMHTFQGGPLGLIGALRDSVGATGTLLMPAYSTNSMEHPPRPFHVTKEPTYTGLASELFRRTPGVTRSLHPRHSICGLGPMAESLLSSHEECIRADGPDSPFDRLRRLDDAFIATLGLPFGVASFFHWVEDYEPEKLPFPVHAAMPVRCLVHDATGRALEVLDWGLRPEVAVGESSAPVARLLSTETLTTVNHRGVLLCIYRVKPFARELLALRDRGVLHYARPGWRRLLG